MNGDEQGEIGLPAFVTGGQSNGGGSQPSQSGGYQQNGFEGPTDRFPLHRRRRRRHGPRPDAPQASGPETGE
jgi:hypothetical protein